MNPERNVIVAGLAAGGIPLLLTLRDDKSEAREARQVKIMIGTFLLVAALLLLVNWWPDAATGLATLVLVTSLVVNGVEFAKLMSSLVD